LPRCYGVLCREKCGGVSLVVRGEVSEVTELGACGHSRQQRRKSDVSPRGSVGIRILFGPVLGSLNGVEHRENRQNAHRYTYNGNGIRTTAGPP
jgi:hypothetical protein